MDAQLPPTEKLALMTELEDEYYPYEKEEIFEQDGFVEDIIAVDYKCS